MDEAPFPSVIFVFGYKTSAIDLRNFYQYESWGRLVAAEGIVGIAYDTERPNVDLETLIAFLQEHAAEFKIDPERIGLWASSSNVPTAMSYVMQEGEDIAKFAVLYYGHMLSPDNYLREEINAQCAQRGCYSKELKDIQQIRSDLPLFIVRAGRDVLPHVNESIDHFMANFADEAIPITYIEYKDGLHGFDVEQRTDQSAEIIEKTIKFMKLHLGID
ncbi:MAG: hypothetical protein GTO42_01240 [Candidatus Latescibacteria bacterium]|nr:hypothetical protein [Candidatus Latescibacterota bacterium]NIT37684.1 hypothetical protein [Candidatus Latescibacterota bacterium]